MGVIGWIGGSIIFCVKLNGVVINCEIVDITINIFELL